MSVEFFGGNAKDYSRKSQLVDKGHFRKEVNVLPMLQPSGVFLVCV